jgi:hypothetical protein
MRGPLLVVLVTCSSSSPAMHPEVASPFAPPPSWMTPVTFELRFTLGIDEPSRLQLVP